MKKLPADKKTWVEQDIALEQKKPSKDKNIKQ